MRLGVKEVASEISEDNLASETKKCLRGKYQQPIAKD